MTITAITLMFFGYGYYAVLIGYSAYLFLSVILLWKNFQFKLRRLFSKEKLSELLLENIFKYGVLIVTAFVFGLNTFAYLFLAYEISYFMYLNITLFVTDFLMNKFKTTEELFRFNLIKLIEYASFVIVPFTVIMVTLSKQFSEYGIKWLGFSDVLIILLFSSMFKGIFEITRIVFLTQKKEIISFRIKLFELGLLAVLYIVFMFLDIFGIALAILISSVLSSVVHLLLSERIITLDLITVSRDYFYIFFSGVLTALALGLLKEWFAVNNFISFVSMFTLGIFIYLILTFVFNNELYKRFIRFVYNLLEE